MGNSCTALGQRQQCAPSADLESHLHGRHREAHPWLVLAVVEAVVSRYISSWWHCWFNQSLPQTPGPTPVLSLRMLTSSRRGELASTHQGGKMGRGRQHCLDSRCHQRARM